MPRAYIRRRLLRRRPIRRRFQRGRAIVKKTNLSGLGLHYFKRRYVVANITASTSAVGIQTNAAGALTFSLSALPNSSEFTSLFDAYKVMKVSLDWLPFGDSVNLPISTMTGTSSLMFPGGPLITVVDYDDAGTPAAASDLLQYQTAKVTPVPRRHKMSLRPKFAIDVNNGMSTGYGPRSGWLDTAYPGIPHYGVKYYLNAPSASSSSFTYQVWATVTIACKGVN